MSADGQVPADQGPQSNGGEGIMEPEYIVAQSGATCWHRDKMPFTEEVQRRAEVELNEQPEKREQAIASLRQMVEEQADIQTRMDDDFLLRFLRARKFNLDRAYKLLRNHNLALKKYPAIFGDPRPSSIKEYIFQYSSTLLPYRDPEGRIIVVIKLSEIDVGRTPFEIFLRIVAMCVELALQDPVTQVNGVVAILDFSDVGMSFLRHIVTPTKLHTIFVLLQDCFPGRVKEKHCVFGPGIVKLCVDAAKVFMNTKMKKRILFHGEKMQSLHRYIPPEILPQEYGGTMLLDKSAWARKIMSGEKLFIEAVKFASPQS